MPVVSRDLSSLKTMLWRSDESWVEYTPQRTNKAKEDLTSLIGTTIDKYEIETLLGRGGMGWVFLARHLHLNRSCALKLLSPELVAADPEYLDRFCTEGQAAASLVHPNIVTVHAIGQHAELNFLEMEFIPGRSLQSLLREGPLPTLRATTLAYSIAQGLAAAHRIGVVHRDLKPDNVLLTHRGIPKIADFGLAKRVQGSAFHEGPGVLVGTPHFMAPEVFAGKTATAASDVYALGVSLYFMLTGNLPFTERDINSLVNAVTNQRPPGLRKLRDDIPLELAECVSLMLEKSPENRPRDGIEATQLISAVLGLTRDIESLLHEALDNERHVKWSREGVNYRVSVTLSSGRHQTVFIETSQHNFHDRLLHLYSLCCPAEDHYFRDALRLNSEIYHGALALREVNGHEFFVMHDAYPRSTVDGEEIRRSVLELAVRADAVEDRLTGQDHH